MKNEYRPDPTRMQNDLIRNKLPLNDSHNNSIVIGGGSIDGRAAASGSMAGISVASGGNIPHNGASHTGIVPSSWKSPMIGPVAVPGTPSAMGGGVSANKTPRGNIVIALYTYQGSEFGDMSFKKGDQMEILDKT